MENYSLSDIAAATGEGGFGGSSWVLIILFALIFGGNGLFGGNRGGEQYATSSDVQRGFDTQDITSQLRGIANGISQGFSDSTFALNNAMGSGFADIKQSLSDIRYENANNTAAINANISAQAQKILDTISTNRINDLQSRVNQLETSSAIQSATCGVVKYPMASTYAMSNPYCNCGCNNV